MAIRIVQSATLSAENLTDSTAHTLIVLSVTMPEHLSGQSQLQIRLARARMQYADLAKNALTLETPAGGLQRWVVLDQASTPFQRHTQLRKALKPLLDEHPAALAIVVLGSEQERAAAAQAAVYVAAVNAAELPKRKSQSQDKQTPPVLETIHVQGWEQPDGYASLLAQAAGNLLTRSLTVLPPNMLTPTLYRERIRSLASEHGWEITEYDVPALRAMGAGAFVAVGQGSEPEDAAIVHLRYVPKSMPPKSMSEVSSSTAPAASVPKVALVGKGICFDTGGHNLKPARYMLNMHEDMNGSAVVLGMLQAATQMALPMQLDGWLAIAQNHIGPKAYKQNDVVTALNGRTIEIMHTDAEGRMVLADTLTLASRGKPEFMMDFATLTGSMITALGDRYSGVIANQPALLCKALGAGHSSGERVNAFPFDADYDEDLDSEVADIKQCTLDGEADHILAARFLSTFIEGDVPWLHVDLSAARRKGGLGAVGSDVTGFGVGFGLAMLQALQTRPTTKE
ncbi:M17 family metallopeptidase [Methylobacillus flagellatus]|uniref:M17 family metallopeptidase n=1 Tax=Methylobacillus flagellatus TaxID=405 RepID=UPI0010F4B5A5|nr:leucyl aminopeptidase family protein [Methylobacillus flagellatus]